MNNGVIMANTSLVLQRVNRLNSGQYVCVAINDHGAGKSNAVDLLVKCEFLKGFLTNARPRHFTNCPFISVRPVCSTARVPRIGVSRGENITVTCEVSSNPPVKKFRWRFNGGGKAVEIR